MEQESYPYIHNFPLGLGHLLAIGRMEDGAAGGGET